MTPDEFDKLTAKAQAEAIHEHELDQTWFGFCAACGNKITATLRAFPFVCPHCGSDGSS